jgi:hypothetical protein
MRFLRGVDMRFHGLLALHDNVAGPFKMTASGIQQF